MPPEIFGSKMPDFASDVKTSNIGYGQGGYSGPSSLISAQARRVSKTYASLATDTMNATANPGDWQTRKINASPLKPAFAQKSPDASAKVPTTLLSRSVPASAQPAVKGNYKR
jgi:hypothetical protein